MKPPPPPPQQKKKKNKQIIHHEQSRTLTLDESTPKQGKKKMLSITNHFMCSSSSHMPNEKFLQPRGERASYTIKTNMEVIKIVRTNTNEWL